MTFISCILWSIIWQFIKNKPAEAELAQNARWSMLVQVTEYNMCHTHIIHKVTNACQLQSLIHGLDMGA